MHRFAIIFLALIGLSQAALTDHLPSFLRSNPTKTDNKQPSRGILSRLLGGPSVSLQGLLDIQQARQGIETERQQAKAQVNAPENQDLRREINQYDTEIETLLTEIIQRREEQLRDQLDLNRNLGNRVRLRKEDYNTAKASIESMRKLVKLARFIHKQYGNALGNIIGLTKNTGTNPYESLKDSYEKTQKAYEESLRTLNDSLRIFGATPEIMALKTQIAELTEKKALLLQKLKESLSASTPMTSDPLAKLKQAIKAARCPAIKDPGQVNDPRMVQCFILAFQDFQRKRQMPEKCSAIMIPGVRSSQSFDQTSPIDNFVNCAKVLVDAKSQGTSAPKPARETPLDLTLRLELLYRNLTTGSDLSAKTSTAEREFRASDEKLREARDEYQKTLAKLREDLSRLADELRQRVAKYQTKIDSILDRTYIPERDDPELIDALTKDDGADELQEAITNTVKKAAKTKALQAAGDIIKIVDPNGKLIQVDSETLLTAYRKLRDQVQRDLALAQRFQNSQLLSTEMRKAVEYLGTKYPGFRVSDDLDRINDLQSRIDQLTEIAKNTYAVYQKGGVLGVATAGVQAGAKTATQAVSNWWYGPPPEKPYSVDSSLDRKHHKIGQAAQDQQRKFREYGEARAKSEAEASRRATMTAEAGRIIERLQCPSMRNADDLNAINLDKCANLVLSSVPQQKRDQFPSCYPWSSAGTLQCVRDIQSGRPVKPEVQLRILVDQLRAGLNARRVLKQADSVVKAAHGQINALPKAHEQFNEALAKLSAFKDMWLKNKRLQIQGLRSRQAEAQQHYETLSAKLERIQQGWAQYFAWLSQLKDQTQAFMTLLMTSTLTHNAPLEHPNLAQDVAKLDRLLQNLQNGLKDLESRMMNFEDDPRYQRDSKVIREQFDLAKKSLLDLQTALDSSMMTADTSLATIDAAIKSLGCKWFQNIGAGNKGLSQCMSAMSDRVRQLGVLLKKPGCQRLDPNSLYLVSDLDQCSIGSSPSGPVNEGDLVKGARIIQGMDGYNTDAMINRLMEQGGYSRDQATDILKQMMLL